ncbi:MAG: ATPase [Rhodospirillaceae bacterium]|jgi:chaperone required for assembly of F1-ATPase|nr:ATPase [Rhodospirillaceae bacterium]MBT4218439.1 ATPase [Rhodospirillaceae bacterium]MBT7356201.1 ATPase [Rhodospirillaceae bacterium]
MPETSSSAKRFYDTVDVNAVDDGFGVTLDGRAVPTPLGQPLVLMSRKLADAIADEWRAQGETVDPRSMPLSGLANTACDRTNKRRTDVIKETLGYGAMDMVCYRVDAPEDLARRQHDCWQGLIDWAGDTIGVQMQTTTGLLPVTQPAENAELFERRLQEFDSFGLTGVSALTTVTGSLIIALAAADAHITADAAFNAAELDEIYQNERWGQDMEAAKRHQNLRADIATAAKFMTLASSLV